jgi:hypothetical protein
MEIKKFIDTPDLPTVKRRNAKRFYSQINHDKIV